MPTITHTTVATRRAAASVFAAAAIVAFAAVATTATGAADSVVPASPAAIVAVPLAPAKNDSAVRLRWSPKGARVELTLDGAALVGSIRLGAADSVPIAVRLERSPNAQHYDRLQIDLDRDGRMSPDEAAGERLTAVPREQRGKWWSSFSATVPIAVPATVPPTVAVDGGPAITQRPYPINLWFVADPADPDAAPALRWSRRGWHEGTCTIGGEPAHVLVTDRAMDGRFDRRDSWMIARDPEDLGRTSRSLSEHAWLDGVAWMPVRIDEHGRFIEIEPFDPGMTEAEERDKADWMRPDREAPRAAVPLAFGHDLETALAAARRDRERGEGRGLVFLDFETTWCGPCKQMDQWVYTAAAVVAAAEGVHAVKLDGDVARDMVKRYEVRGYPTMLMLDADGTELARAVGYRGVAAMAAFLRGE